MSGKVVHFEIPADDVERARDFYREAFGWTIRSMPGMDYSLVGTTPSDENGMPTEVGGINGGMLTRQPPITAPVIVVDVADIDATLTAVEKLGGAVTRGREPVGDMGFAAYLTDPEGNVIGLWQTAAGG
ncbi:MAG TPA: VOC family protein [Cryptosporangiaceae bacterium]|nr:VOC family protein [Cryptosporangiaceae bacterium]